MNLRRKNGYNSPCLSAAQARAVVHPPDARDEVAVVRGQHQEDRRFQHCTRPLYISFVFPEDFLLRSVEFTDRCCCLDGFRSSRSGFATATSHARRPSRAPRTCISSKRVSALSGRYCQEQALVLSVVVAFSISVMSAHASSG